MTADRQAHVPSARDTGPPPWWFGVTNLPFGVAGGFTGTGLGFILRSAGVPLPRIAAIGALSLLPSAYQFLWAPLLDFGLRQRTWLVLLSCLGSACLAGSLLVPVRTSLPTVVLLAVLGQGLVGLVGSCNGALIARTGDPSRRGRAAGWVNVGNLGGGALGGGAVVSLASVAARGWLAAALMVMIVAPALLALRLPEPPPERGHLRARLRGFARSTWSVARSRAGWTGILFCLSPVGTAAVLNVLAALGADYRADAATVALVNGYAGGLVTAAGALVGGWLCDRIPRRAAYLGAGLLTALVAAAMSAGPATPTTYAVFGGLYLFVAGLCYAAFSAVVLQIVGQSTGGAATQYTLFTAAGNQAIAYVLALDGWAYRAGGATALLRCDAALNAAGVACLGAALLLLRRKDQGTATRVART